MTSLATPRITVCLLTFTSIPSVSSSLGLLIPGFRSPLGGVPGGEAAPTSTVASPAVISARVSLSPASRHFLFLSASNWKAIWY